MTTLARSILVAIAAASLAACALFPGAHDRAMRRTQAYRAGYADGCAAANAAGTRYRRGPVRNTRAFRGNRLYRAGWNTGYSACRGGVTAPGSDPQHPFNEPSPGR
jgi:hypothetical protein